jgi:peptidoglycan/xylan/chitin deacetylase (PgdA/CDA1 family)
VTVLSSAVSLARPVWRLITRPVGTVRSVTTRQPHLVLTYDDGPDPAATPGVLASLAEFGATATFFVLVPRARGNRRLLEETLAAGHEVALHGIDHTRLTSYSAAEVHRRTGDGRAELEDLIGRRVRWFRAPYGALLPQLWAAVRAAGLTPVGWGPTPGDWRSLPESRLATDALDGCSTGGILLAHDGFAGPSDGVDDGPPPDIDRGKLASLMLAGLRDRGLSGRSLGDSVASGGRTRSWAWFHR